MAGTGRIPKPTLERLPRYLRVLRRYREMGQGETAIASRVLGFEAGIEEFQVRKDLSYVPARGLPSRGYQVSELEESLDELLGHATLRNAAVLGAGRLGAALSQYAHFPLYGFKVVLLLDKDEKRVGHPVGPFTVQHADRMPALLLQHNVCLGIIAVPDTDAQEMADRLIRAGVRGLWNFAPVKLTVPSGVYIRNEDLGIGLSFLSYHVR